MNEAMFKQRTKAVAVGVLALVAALPGGRGADVIARQMARSGTSIGANYRAACRARSVAEVIAKLGIVEEEADETLYWLELLEESGAVEGERLIQLKREVGEILAMTVASKKTLKLRVARESQGRRYNRKSGIENRK